MGIKEIEEASFKPFSQEELKTVDAQLDIFRASLTNGGFAAAVMVGVDAKQRDRNNTVYVAASTRQVMEAIKNLCVAIRCECIDPECQTNRYSSLIKFVATGYLSNVPLLDCVQDITNMAASSKTFSEILRGIATRQSGRGKMN